MITKNILDSSNDKKRKNNYTSNVITLDHDTGEITREESTFVSKTDLEPDYVKVYLNTLCAFKGLSKSISPVLFEFCNYMTWANDNTNRQILIINKFVKEQVSAKVGLKIDRINKILGEIVKSQIFMKMEGQRGVYIVNPYIIARGDWKSIKTLRAEFDFIDGSFKLITQENEENNENNEIKKGL